MVIEKYPLRPFGVPRKERGTGRRGQVSFPGNERRNEYSFPEKQRGGAAGFRKLQLLMCLLLFFAKISKLKQSKARKKQRFEFQY